MSWEMLAMKMVYQSLSLKSSKFTISFVQETSGLDIYDSCVCSNRTHPAPHASAATHPLSYQKLNVSLSLSDCQSQEITSNKHIFRLYLYIRASLYREVACIH